MDETVFFYSINLIMYNQKGSVSFRNKYKELQFVLLFCNMEGDGKLWHFAMGTTLCKQIKELSM
jgi:hypothetical protein